MLDTNSKSNRRDFIRMATATATAGSLPSWGQDGADTAVKNVVRMRKTPSDVGWTYAKVKTVARDFPARADETPPKTGKFGGNAHLTWKATGKFRTEKAGSRWWLVDPEGHPFLSMGVNAVYPGPGELLRQTVQEQGGDSVWSKQAVQTLQSWGFNTMGYWSMADGGRVQSVHSGMPYVYYGFGLEHDRPHVATVPQGLMACFASSVGADLDVLPAFHPQFEMFCLDRCQIVAGKKTDPWLLGYFTDNELSFPSLDHCLTIEVSHPVYAGLAREARTWWAARSGSKSKPVEKDLVEWQAHTYDWYLGIAAAAIRRHDPDHLVLGSRLYAWERNHPQVVAAVGRHVDVLCVNPYGLFSVPDSRLHEWSKWAGDKPVLIGEFYIKGADAPVDNVSGAGLVVSSQQERGLFYQNYALGLLRSKVCVGWHWHQYADEVQDLRPDLGSNKGLFNARLLPYESLVQKASELNLRVHDIVTRMIG